MNDSHRHGVRFHFLVSFSLPARIKLKKAIQRLFDKEKTGFRSLDIVFCSDEYLLKINQDYLQHDDLTDIITFDLSENDGMIDAEIYISIDRVKENARNFKISFLTELYRVIFHGSLHLCGYKDKKPSEQKEMRVKEDLYLKYYQNLS